MKVGKAKALWLFSRQNCAKNASVIYNPLRANDHESHVAVHNRLHAIGKTLSLNLATTQTAYCKNRKRRLSEGRSLADRVISVFEK